ncbi:hypothetical protein [Streptomyces sp. RFCAC02]|uniref:hypothetical protein n=1 Tax=Streptomyces sp. RFCAC02 TaxID=2499143 RepID=UPI00101F513B|nr:hypothetical protein [Streptomyces sp. RFCAC02]
MVRETVEGAADAGKAPEAPEAAPRPATPAPGANRRPGAAASGARSASGASGGKKTSSWFEPRKPPGSRTDTPPQGHPAVTDTPAGGLPAASPAPAPAAEPPARTRTDTGRAPFAGGPEPDHGPGTGPNPLLGDTPPLHTGAPRRTPGAEPGADQWFAGRADTPADGVPQMPQRPAGPTTGPALGGMPLTPSGPRPEDEDPSGTTMDLGGPFPPAPPAELTDLEATGRMTPFTDGATGPLPRVAAGAAPRAATGPAKPPVATGPSGAPPAAGDEPAARPAPEPPAAKGGTKGKAKGGRSKVKLLGVAVVGIAVIAYGAGLFLSPADVPRGTTVLGVDIGGLSTEEAQTRLEGRLQAANSEPLVLQFGEQQIELKPTVAGLAVDAEATAHAVSGQDYSPVAVYGSLFGSERVEDPVFAVDREKLTVALADLSEGVGSGPVDGTVTFTPDGAIAQLGEPGMGLDVEAAADAVESAFRERAAGGGDSVVEVPLTEQQPDIDEADVRTAMEEFAEPAMSGMVSVIAGGRRVDFSPENSLWQFLGMEAHDGRLVETFDLDVLAQLYGGTFDGVLVTRGDGSQTPVTPEDVAGALRMALRETDPAARVVEIDLNAG